MYRVKAYGKTKATVLSGMYKSSDLFACRIGKINP